jgi:integrase
LPGLTTQCDQRCSQVLPDTHILSARLGHSTVALTLDIYSHVLLQADREAAEKIADLLPAC